VLHELNRMHDAEIRSICKEKIESLEHWLRRLIEDTLTPIYDDYFAHVDLTTGNRLIKNSLTQQVESRRNQEPARYPRKIDAVLLEDAVDIICKPELFKQHFRNALEQAFPEGREEARTFLKRLLVPRNNLAHANAISMRQAEQIICYSNDVIDSLKEYYRNLGMQQSYNVPLILKVTDSFGNVFTRSQCNQCHDGGISLIFMDNEHMFLRPGDTLTIEVEVDPAFEADSYTLTWDSTKWWGGSTVVGTKVIIPITNKEVGLQFDVVCRLISNNEWHRMSIGADDCLALYYKVLPSFE
jgi:hypothetical protein